MDGVALKSLLMKKWLLHTAISPPLWHLDFTEKKFFFGWKSRCFVLLPNVGHWCKSELWSQNSNFRFQLHAYNCFASTPEWFGPLKNENWISLYYLCNSRHKLELWNRNPNFRLRLYHLEMLAPTHPKLLGLRLTVSLLMLRKRVRVSTTVDDFKASNTVSTRGLVLHKTCTCSQARHQRSNRLIAPSEMCKNSFKSAKNFFVFR